MAATEKRTISMSPEQGKYIDAKIASGDYASASEVVREGLRFLQDRDATIERWLIEKVIPTYDEMRAHPERGIPAEKVFEALRAHNAERVKREKQ